MRAWLLLPAALALLAAAGLATAQDDPDEPVSFGPEDCIDCTKGPQDPGDEPTYGDCGGEVCAFEEPGPDDGSEACDADACSHGGLPPNDDTVADCGEDGCDHPTLDGGADDGPTYGDCGGEVCAYDESHGGLPPAAGGAAPGVPLAGLVAGSVAAAFLVGALARRRA